MVEIKIQRPLPTHCANDDMGWLSPHCWPQSEPQFIVYGSANDLGEQAPSFTIRVARVIWNKHRTSVEYAECARYKHEYTIPSNCIIGYRHSDTGLSPCGRYVIFWTYDPSVLVCLKLPTIKEMDAAIAGGTILIIKFLSRYVFPDGLRCSGKAEIGYSVSESLVYIDTVGNHDSYIFRYLPQLELIRVIARLDGLPPPTDFQERLWHELINKQTAVRMDTKPSACFLYRNYQDECIHFVDISSEVSIPIHKPDTPDWLSSYNLMRCGVAFFVYAKSGDGFVYILQGDTLLVQSVRALQEQIHNPNFALDNSDGVLKFTLPKSYSCLQLLQAGNPIVIMVTHHTQCNHTSEANDHLPHPKRIEDIYSLDDSVVGYGGVVLVDSRVNDDPDVIHFPNTDLQTTQVNACEWPPVFRKCSSKLLRFYNTARGAALLRRAMEMSTKISNSCHFKELPAEIVLKITQHIPLADDRIDLAVACPATLPLMEEQDDFNILHHARKLLFAAGEGANDLYEHGWLLRLVRFGDGVICKWLANCFQNGDYGAEVDTDLAEEILKFSSPLFDKKGR